MKNHKPLTLFRGREHEGPLFPSWPRSPNRVDNTREPWALPAPSLVTLVHLGPLCPFDSISFFGGTAESRLGMMLSFDRPSRSNWPQRWDHYGIIYRQVRTRYRFDKQRTAIYNRHKTEVEKSEIYLKLDTITPPVVLTYLYVANNDIEVKQCFILLKYWFLMFIFTRYW